MKNAHHILYVDDEEQNLRAFQLAFKKRYQVHVAPTAAAGKALLQQYPIKVVITDQMMPEITGVQFLTEIIPDFPDVIRIVMTAYSNPRDIIEMINKGQVYQFVPKPWQKSSLNVTLEQALERYELKSQNQELVSQLQRANQTLEQKVKDRTEALSLSNKQLKSKNQMIELLLREVNHRVINKLNILKVLIRREVEDTDEALFQQKLQKLEEKVDELSKIHRQLMYWGNKKQQTNLQNYFQQIIEILQKVYQETLPQVRIQVDISSTEIPQNQAYFLGFILYELLTNSFKYADFQNIIQPEVVIHVLQNDEVFELHYSDNGKGLPDALFYGGKFQLNKLSSLGLKIVELITIIHQGKFHVQPPQSTASGAAFQCTLDFKTLEQNPQ